MLLCALQQSLLQEFEECGLNEERLMSVFMRLQKAKLFAECHDAPVLILMLQLVSSCRQESCLRRRYPMARNRSHHSSFSLSPTKMPR